ncbi:Hypothetical predicted protein [Mytilus galloprovincialis]|uniref:B box-type domain-containing protein n=1 Tax=Mytilus galloprovincialis TaxID=29158 RepID=A0A8B6H0S0_MYTGA|nr:Hypothetical predicted protein [Mytilus galloprovincialis]
MECDKHNQPLNLYCPSHLMPCCNKCSHSKCIGITSLASVVEKTTIENSKVTVEIDINYFLSILDQLVTSKLKNIKTGEDHCIGLQKSINETRKEINKHLDQLEEKNSRQKRKLEGSEKTVTTNTSKLQSFLRVHKIEQQVHKCQRYIEDLEDDERTKEVDIKIKQNDEIENIFSKLVSLDSLGEITIVKTEINLNRERSLRRKAQVQSQEQSNINNMTMNIETKIKINIEKRMSDMICLIDGRVLAVESFGKINVFTSDGIFQKQLHIPGEAFSVTQIYQNTIAITYPSENAIKIFNMENETVTKVFKIGKPCFGLSFSNNSLAVGFEKDEIRIMDLEGNTLTSIHVQSESHLFNLSYCDKRVFYSDHEGKAVYCVDESGKQIWQYKQDLTDPRGLCKDTYGNIFVADCALLIVISKDGQGSKVLIGREDRVKYPQCICFKHNASSGFICDYNGSKLVKFDLSRE